MSGIYLCCDKVRREQLKGDLNLNGIDFLEVIDDPTASPQIPQQTLVVHFINHLTGSPLTEKNVSIDGGERITGIYATSASSQSNVLTVVVNKPGDFSLYTFRLVKIGDPEGKPPDNYDPILSSIDFSFKANCPSDFDCRIKSICPSPFAEEPDINYLAKDFASFRQLMLDRISALVPQWQERNPTDLGVALVEVLAYVGDYLSYSQDAVATEAYLGTARSRISARRHARLVDYFMHDGCNSRVFLQVKVSGDLSLPGGSQTKFLTAVSGLPGVILSGSAEYTKALNQGAMVFEAMLPKSQWLLFESHNEMHFYTWMDSRCCLPRGATSATLVDNAASRLTLKADDILILRESLGPQTGDPADADPTHIWAIRLTKVAPEAVDSVVNGVPTRVPGTEIMDALTNQPIVEIEWHPDDALPFPLCISTKQVTQNVSVALGNIVLADYGLTIDDELLDPVPESTIQLAPDPNADRCIDSKPDFIPQRFRPSLQETPLTFAAPYNPAAPDNPATPQPSAVSTMTWNPDEALPVISLNTGSGSQEWLPKYDLLRSQGDSLEFVVESESDGTAHLRFGDGQHGKSPASSTVFHATYRTGNGAVGNIGAGSLKHLVLDLNNFSKTASKIMEVGNMLPSQGGVDPESIESVRQRAPSAFRIQERAVTLEDYANVALRCPNVSRAAAVFRWTGSWYTVFLAVEPKGSFVADDAFKANVLLCLEKYRMAGYDLEIEGPKYVPLEVDMTVCVKPGYFRSDVEGILTQVFSSKAMPDGSRGLFSPDNFGFGQPVYLSALYAAVQEVAGVAWARVQLFQRISDPNTDAVDSGVLVMGRQEIARLDNDPNFPEHGVFRLSLMGGK